MTYVKYSLNKGESQKKRKKPGSNIQVKENDSVLFRSMAPNF